MFPLSEARTRKFPLDLGLFAASIGIADQLLFLFLPLALVLQFESTESLGLVYLALALSRITGWAMSRHAWVNPKSGFGAAVIRCSAACGLALYFLCQSSDWRLLTALLTIYVVMDMTTYGLIHHRMAMDESTFKSNNSMAIGVQQMLVAIVPLAVAYAAHTNLSVSVLAGFLLISVLTAVGAIVGRQIPVDRSAMRSTPTRIWEVKLWFVFVCSLKGTLFVLVPLLVFDRFSAGPLFYGALLFLFASGGALGAYHFNRFDLDLRSSLKKLAVVALLGVSLGYFVLFSITGELVLLILAPLFGWVDALVFTYVSYRVGKLSSAVRSSSMYQILLANVVAVPATSFFFSIGYRLFADWSLLLMGCLVTLAALRVALLSNNRNSVPT